MSRKNPEPPQTALAASKRLKALSSARRAKISAWFFKTGPGDYGEGDQFLGITVPALRRETRAFDKLGLPEIERLLASPWHEERLFALLILVRRYERGESAERERIFRFYLAQRSRVNNWDLVDVSAPSIVGEHLAGRSFALLRRLVRSRVLWERRIAVVATFAFLRRGQVLPTFELAYRLLGDPEELLHKATGWALREAGKKDAGALRAFLARHAAVMPRTMLRYAIERFPRGERLQWMKAGGPPRRRRG
jgi:3-methyladenine DNA glycosylase AlkD